MTKNNGQRLKLFSLSPWLLGGACILLLMVIALFAVNTYKREKGHITKGLEHKGLTLVRFINSDVRDSVRSVISTSRSYEQWDVYMERAIALAVEQPGVDSIAIADKDGNLILSVGSEIQTGNEFGGQLLSLLAKYRQANCW